MYCVLIVNAKVFIQFSNKTLFTSIKTNTQAFNKYILANRSSIQQNNKNVMNTILVALHRFMAIQYELNPSKSHG